MENVIVKDLMSKVETTALDSDFLLDVAHEMRVNRLSCMIVLDGKLREPVGIITERDLVSVLCNVLEEKQDTNAIHVSDFMSSPPIIIEQDASIFDALVLTQARKIRHLPVVNKSGNLVGMLTYTDLAHAHLHIIEMQREMIEQAVDRKTQELEVVNKNLLLANEQLKELSLEDALLEIGNRRAMEVDLEYTHSAAVRYRRPYSIVLFDVDCFKQYNDFYGHAKGDEALKLVASYLSDSIRTADRLYRYGGEELLLILPETDENGAHILSERLLKDLEEQKIPHEKSQFKVITMSGGVGSLNIMNGKCNWKSVIEIADKNLYKAKHSGRNQICCTQTH